MPLIWTKENHVVAYEADEGDTHVQVMWLGPSELHGGQYAKQFHTPLQPIEDYQAAVAWAVGMADQLRFPLHVVPMTGAEALRTEQVQRGVASLTGQQRGDLRALMVKTMAEVMRDSGDPAVRADAYNILRDMKVVRP